MSLCLFYRARKHRVAERNDDQGYVQQVIPQIRGIQPVQAPAEQRGEQGEREHASAAMPEKTGEAAGQAQQDGGVIPQGIGVEGQQAEAEEEKDKSELTRRMNELVKLPDVGEVFRL